jgi:pyruvate/2-oxoglutarate dehydrogenase complex dihydrolipoamide acyltransferase (E2) component
VIAADVVFPPLSQDQPDAEGVLATWFVADGDQVAQGQLLGEVMVEKVSGEVHAPATGRVRLLVAEEQTARQGEVIAVVE